MKVAINGLGRIGKLAFKIGLERGINFVAINDLTDIKTLVYLLRYSQKPEGIKEKHCKLYRVVCERLVEKKQL